MGMKNADTKSTDEFSRWLICMFRDIHPSLLENEIPELDLESVTACSADQNPEPEAEPQTHTNWRVVVAVSGFAAACSAAVAGIAVFACMRHLTAFDGTRRA
ncbi:MAG: hypothetical protein LUH00_02660 [Lachnospiraceae bacterium]|nr:hypothetical protein [Lachnospiraceae bacterium]